MCKTAAYSRHSTQQSRPGQQQQQACGERPVVLTTTLVAAEAMTAYKMTASKMTATAVRRRCREKEGKVTLRSALMMSEAVAPALSS